MIPKADIVAWRQVAPWISDAQVEQDLIISRALVSIFQDEFIAEQLAFRGGTALHKLYFNPEDVTSLLPADMNYDVNEAFSLVIQQIVSRIESD